MDKFTKLPNKVLEAMYQYRFSPAQYSALLYIGRHTFGWNKKTDSVSIKRMAEETGYTRRGMMKAVNSLEADNVISIYKAGAGRIAKIGIKDPDEWRKPVNASTHVNTGTHVNASTQGGVNSGSQGGVNASSQVPVNAGSHTKDNKDIIKDNLKKEPSGPSDDESGYMDWDEVKRILAEEGYGDL